MKIPDHLSKPLLEQLADQADSVDFIVIRGTALGYGLQARAVGMLVLDQKADDLLDQAKEIFETELEKALPDLPDDIAIDVATEPLKIARQSRSGLMENAFLSEEWKTCVNEAEHGRSIIPDYLLYQPHRDGYPIEFVAKGMDNDNKDLVTKGVEMQEEFLQYVIEVGYLKPWEEAYFVSYAISLISRRLIE